jgi:hypothetical protein
MKNMLPSGSFLPAGLLDVDGDVMSLMKGFNHTYGNFGIKSGIVTKVHEKTDETNITKACPEYDVAVFEQNQDGGQNTITYPNCIAGDLMGAIADFVEFRYRAQNKADGKGTERVARQQNGAIVMIMCLTGASDKAVIMGGLNHPKRESKLTKDAGHTLLGEFNGLSLEIDKDGAFKIGFKGATDNEGKPAKADVGGSYLKIEKDGSLELGDAKGESLRLDKTAQTVSMKSAKAMSLDTGDALKMKSAKATDMQMKDWMVKATGSATMTVKSLDIKSDAAIKIQGKTLDVKADSMMMFKSQMITLDGLVNLGGPGGTPALTIQTNFLGIGNLGLPVMSNAIGPFSAKVFIF